LERNGKRKKNAATTPGTLKMTGWRVLIPLNERDGEKGGKGKISNTPKAQDSVPGGAANKPMEEKTRAK